MWFYIILCTSSCFIHSWLISSRICGGFPPGVTFEKLQRGVAGHPSPVTLKMYFYSSHYILDSSVCVQVIFQTEMRAEEVKKEVGGGEDTT